MTGITLIRGINMRGGLACRDHIIMTGFAGSLRFVVVHGYNRYPGDTIVAGLTEITGENVIDTLTGGRHPIMTGDTGLCCR